MKSIKDLTKNITPAIWGAYAVKVRILLEQAQAYHEEQMKERDKEIEELKEALKSQCKLSSFHINRGNEFQEENEGLKKVIQYWESIIKAELSLNIQKFVKEARKRFNISEEDEDKKAYENGKSEDYQ